MIPKYIGKEQFIDLTKFPDPTSQADNGNAHIFDNSTNKFTRTLT